MEGRAPISYKRKGKQGMSTQLRDATTLKTTLHRIIEKAQSDKDTVFTSVIHAINMDSLRHSFLRLDGSKAEGIDGVTKKAYEVNLESNLKDLLLRIRNRSYFPKPAKIVEIPKADGTYRPLAISCLEDKIVQEVVRCLLEGIFEPLFLDCSHGFRPERGCDTALVDLNRYISNPNCGAVLDIDLKSYFNTIPHKPLLAMLEEKISQKHFLWFIAKLLRSSYLDKDGKSQRNECGVPQGNIFSPVLANLYLHNVIDKWLLWVNAAHFNNTVNLVRYADDGIFTFRNTADAFKFLAMLEDQLTEFGIALNKDKTCIVSWGVGEAKRRHQQGKPMPQFTFLGFLHIWGQSKNSKTGKLFWRPKRRTCPKRFRRKLTDIKEYIAKHRHDKNLIERTIQVVKGHANYFFVNDNQKRVRQFSHEVRRILFKYLNKRSQCKSFTWGQFVNLTDNLGYPTKFRIKNLFFSMKRPPPVGVCS